MPWHIVTSGSKFEVVKDSDGAVVGTHPSRKQARAQLAALYANEGGKSAALEILEAMKIGRRNNSGDAAKLKQIQALIADLLSNEEAEPDEGDMPMMGKSIDYSYVKSIGVDLPDYSVLAVKSVGVDMIRHPVFIWGHPDKRDVEREYFDRQTDFWDDALKSHSRPLTWDHMQDGTMKASPIIGHTVEYEDDEIARWAVSQLDRSHRYNKAVNALIAAGELGSSSDTALQYVIRQPTKSGATYIKQWPWFASALTTTPAEPRTKKDLAYFKSIGFDYPFPEASVVQMRRQVEKAQRDIELLKLSI